MDFAKAQEELLQQRDALFKSLGMDEVAERFDDVLSKADQSLHLKRKASALEADVGPVDSIARRRSLRVRGVTPVDGGAGLVVESEHAEERRRCRARPEGDISWDQTLIRPGVRSAGIHIFDELRGATARLLSLPAPPPLAPAVAATEPAAAVSEVVAAHVATAASGATAAHPAVTAHVAVAASAAPHRRPTRSATAAASLTRDVDVTVIEETGASSASITAAVTDAAAATAAEPSASFGHHWADGGLLAAFDRDAGFPLPLAQPEAAAGAAAVAGGGRRKGEASALPRRLAAAAASNGSSVAPASASSSALTRLSLPDEAAVLKVLPDRIYSAAFHPSPHTVVGICGSKSGLLSLWRPDLAWLLDVRAAAAAQAEVSTAANASDALALAAAGLSTRRVALLAGDDDEEEGEEEGVGSSGAALGAKRARQAEDGDAGTAGSSSSSAVASSGGGGGAHGGLVAVFAPHTAPINALAVPRGAPHLVVTCSYDGSVRALDINAGASWEWFSGGDDCSVSGMDLMGVTQAAEAGGPSSGPGIACTVVCGGYDGSVFLVDPRAHPRRAAHRFHAHERKVNSVSAVGGGGAYFLTSSSDSTVKLWDIRRLTAASGDNRTTVASSKGRGRGAKLPSPSSLALAAGAPVATVGSAQAVTSAFVSPAATRVVATCNDNKLRLWDADWAGPSLSPHLDIAHNNHTGRWLSAIRTIFDPSDDGVIVSGNMDRSVEVFDAASGTRLAALRSTLLTAVPTINAVHPHAAPGSTDRFLLSATASGRLHLWL